MTKRLQNLERLCEKMQARYGEQDTMVNQLMTELAELKLLILQKKELKDARKVMPGYTYGRTHRPKAGLDLH
jgi:phage shock protein A